MFRRVLATLVYLTLTLSIVRTGQLRSGRTQPQNNQPPIVLTDSYTVHGSLAPLSPAVTANDSDPDGDPISVSGVQLGPNHGQLNRLTGDDFSYIPTNGYVGPDSFVYEVCDNHGACGSATVTLDVVNQSPVAVPDTYTVHGVTTVGPMLANDSDPDGDSISFSTIVGFPIHGTLEGLPQPDLKSYRPDFGFRGKDEFSYRVCDRYLSCSEATVTLNVNNDPPVAGDDSYTTHGITTIGPMLANDTDPDGDQISYVQTTGASHGTVYGITQPDIQSYHPDSGYVGLDSFTYKACDPLSACSNATVTLNVVNKAPLAGDDEFTIRGTTTIGPLSVNDSDPDGDSLSAPAIVSGAAHGTVYGLTDPDLKSYQPDPGYAGADTFTYQICDYLGACSTATVTLLVLESDGAENFGKVCPNRRVGQPVDVTNGNMHLQQNDYQLPGRGTGLEVDRTYNTGSQRVGLFGRGWSTGFDEALKIYSSTMLRLYLPDGQATNFRRSSNGIFDAIEPDFRGQIAQRVDGSFTLSLKDGRVERFDPAGRLLSLVDRNNNQTVLSYDGNARLVSLTDTFGRVLNLISNANGQILSVSDSLGTVANYTYGAGNELLSVSYADGSRFQFSYDGQYRLTAVMDALANILESHTYDSQGRALTSERQGGVERITLNYVSDTETDVTDALSHTTKYFFDKSKGRNIVTRVDGLCSCGSGSQSQSWAYDDQLNLISHTNALNQTVTYTYDGDGNQLTMTNALGQSSNTYNGFGQVLTSTDPLGGVTTNTYDAVGNLLSVRDALNNATTFSYDTRGELLTATDASSSITTFSYDAGGNLKQKIDGAGGIARFAYDARGRITSATDELANTTRYGYDPAGRVSRITRPDNSFITFSYDLAGRRIKVTDALNNSTSFNYDGAYRLTGLTDAAGKIKSYAYDLMSNLSAQTDELGRTTNFEYDEFNRLIKVSYPPAALGAARTQETIEYDAAGNVQKRTNQAARVTSFEYDGANRLVKATDPAQQITQYEYDARSNVTAVVDAIHQRYAFDHDSLGRLTSVTRAGLVMSFTYDAVGNRTSRTDFNNLTTSYTYDALDRLTKITYPDATIVKFGYDKLSQLTRAANLNGTVGLSYDNLGRVKSSTDVFGQVLNYTYNGNGNRTKMSLGASANATYRYDSLNRLTRITDNGGLDVNYVYDATSKITSRELPNGVTTTYQYDDLDRLTRLKDAKGRTTLADNQYSYNPVGGLVQNIDQGGTHTYDYDAVDRLVSATYPQTPSETYGYDGVGNRTASHRSPTYGYQPFNRLVSTSTASYILDNNGNLVSKTVAGATTQFAWDFENRLVQVVTPSSGNVTYKYDALGRRIQRAPSNGVATNFIYDGQDVVQDRNSDGSVVDYLNGPGMDNRLRQRSAAGISYFIQDHLGSTTGLTDGRGRVAERISYDGFGNSGGSLRTRYGYTGRERDPQTGLLYYRARWYDPEVGRFISEDPIGLAGGKNFYAYVANDPTNGKDPLGLYNIDVHYYLTYFIATRFSCLTQHEARLIAEADQSTDENPETEPFLGWTEGRRQINSDYHAFNPGNLGNLGNLWNSALNGPANYVGLGRFLHYLQDTFSHRGFGNSVIGQAGRGPIEYFLTDNTNHDVGKAADMVGATWFAIRDWIKAKKCNCGDRGDTNVASWWPQVMEFLNTDNGQLERKRQILGVPAR